MTTNVEIRINAATAELARAEMYKLLGDAHSHGISFARVDESGKIERIAPSSIYQTAAPDPSSAENVASYAPEAELPQEVQDAKTETVEIDKRPLGHPADGNKRRNSAEKSDDDALEALAASKGITIDALNAGIVKAGRAEAAAQLEALPDKAADTEEKAAISTGEERVGPEDDAETQAQDKADEKAETEANGGLPLIEQLRHLIGQYRGKFGMPAAVALVEKDGLIGKAIIDLTDEETAVAIEKVTAALDGETTKAAPDEKPAETAKPATKDDLVAAMKDDLVAAMKDDLVAAMKEYMAKFGEAAIQEDGKRIFKDCFGDSVEKLSQVPEDGYGKAVAAFRDAIENDPYKRAAA